MIELKFSIIIIMNTKLDNKLNILNNLFYFDCFTLYIFVSFEFVS